MNLTTMYMDEANFFSSAFFLNKILNCFSQNYPSKTFKPLVSMHDSCISWLIQDVLEIQILDKCLLQNDVQKAEVTG